LGQPDRSTVVENLSSNFAFIFPSPTALTTSDTQHQRQSNGSYEGTSFQASLFQELWRWAPLNNDVSAISLGTDGRPDPVNQCAVRFSQMLLLSRLGFLFAETFHGIKIHNRYPIKAEEMAKWVTTVFGKPIVLRGPDVTNRLMQKTGIVFLKDFPGVDEPSIHFNHIDL
jgi:hypothetical protein